ncbi:uncharacterized protein H6S33_002273 [Morchella sextelata]|uniref:uncharacterized protein n=1 Tax=Morchella sextelata TaxID=1174677 RepID=UPI001D04BA1F|nr:uncharacterized protein H6S33_002273 [Morchella sextelata]KAH0608221.1 hypothetical protein H6S33_002273 [Morchella sextelata]
MRAQNFNRGLLCSNPMPRWQTIALPVASPPTGNQDAPCSHMCKLTTPSETPSSRSTGCVYCFQGCLPCSHPCVTPHEATRFFTSIHTNATPLTILYQVISVFQHYYRKYPHMFIQCGGIAIEPAHMAQPIEKCD